MIISVVTVSRNAGQTIEQTLCSVLDQKDDDVEYIVIDGGSTDDTLKIIDRYRERIDEVISEPDEGISDAFNKGIRRAHGDVIGIINADDLLYPDAIHHIRDAWKESPDTDVLYGNIMAFSGKDPLEGHEVKSDTDLSKLRYAMLLPHPAVFIKREAYQRFGAYDLMYQYAMDYELVSRMYFQGAVFSHCDHCLASFREGGKSQKGLKGALREHRRIALRNGAGRWQLKRYFLYVRLREFFMPVIRAAALDRAARSVLQNGREKRYLKEKASNADSI